jgi:DNA polymerase III epsilon subunit-like protein
MVYCAIDIETSGLNPETNQILSIGVVVEDTEKRLPFEEVPKFHCAIVREEIVGGLFALDLNRDLIHSINSWNIADKDGKKEIEEQTGMIFLREDEVVPELFRFLYRNSVLNSLLYKMSFDRHFQIIDGVSYPLLNSKIEISHLTCAGKNFATFDKLFLERLPRWKQVFKIRQRVIDPTILFTDWIEDESLPSLSVCKERAGFSGVVTHCAVLDAWDVVELLRTQY